MPEEIPGLKEGGHWFYDLEGAMKLRQALLDFKGGRIAITIGVPHKCPVAPLEITFMLHEYFKQKGMLDKVELFYTYPINRLHSIQSLADWALPEFEKKDIKYETFFNMEEIDPVKKVVRSMEGSELSYDLLITVPPHKGAQVVTDSGLGKDGWIVTDKKTLHNEGYKNIYVVGDTTAPPYKQGGLDSPFRVTRRCGQAFIRNT